jgi:hypothetical protein
MSKCFHQKRNLYTGEDYERKRITLSCIVEQGTCLSHRAMTGRDSRILSGSGNVFSWGGQKDDDGWRKLEFLLTCDI